MNPTHTYKLEIDDKNRIWSVYLGYEGWGVYARIDFGSAGEAMKFIEEKKIAEEQE